MEIEALRGEFRSSIQDMGRLTPMRRIYGRDAEIATLVEALDLAASGRLAVVLIEGESGIGKSRLLAEALESARGRGIQVTAGRAGGASADAAVQHRGRRLRVRPVIA